jgi:hypothetical protein
MFLDRPDEELGLSRGDVLLVPTGRDVDHLRRAVDRREAAGPETLADERRGDAVAAADLEHAILWADVQPVDDRSRAIGHRRSVTNAVIVTEGPGAVRRTHESTKPMRWTGTKWAHADTQPAPTRHTAVTESPIA